MNNIKSHENTSIPALGHHWPEQGGYRAVSVRGQNGQPDYELIVVPVTVKLLGKRAWSNRYERIKGADSRHDGLANTIALAAAGNETALAIQALEVEGHSDLYWPSTLELAAIELNAPELLDCDVWSSTQHGSHYAWYQSFGVGYSHINLKHDQLPVCAVRRFITA